MKYITTKANFEPFTNGISFSHKNTTYNASYAYHRHDGCEVYLFLSGNIKFYIEQTCFTPTPGSLIILNPNEMHRIQCLDSTPYERIVITFSKNYIDSLSPDDFSLAECFYARPLGFQNVRTLSAEALQEFLELYKCLASSKDINCFGPSVIQNTYASLILLFLNQQFQISPSAYKNTMPVYITGTMEYISSHLHEPLCLSVLAKKFHISESYLSSQFKYHTGLTLRTYLLDRKVNYAKLMLQEGASVTDACYNSGFNDYANFIRSFKKITGMSPGKYKKSIP